MIISEISLNTYEIKILKLLSKRDRTVLVYWSHTLHHYLDGINASVS